MQAEKSVLVTVGTTKFDSLIKATDEDKFVAMLSEAGYGNITYQVGLKYPSPNPEASMSPSTGTASHQLPTSPASTTVRT